jgi:hypothetical protein
MKPSTTQIKVTSTTFKELRVIQDGLRDIHYESRTRTNDQLGRYPLGGTR